jgi:rhodanese-related sulfurtransferase
MKDVFLEHFSRIGKALSAPSRLALLDLLCQSEKTVETLVEDSNLALKNVSAQLKVLKDAGLLKSRKVGKYVYYSISDEKVAQFWSNLQQFSSGQSSDLQSAMRSLVSDMSDVEEVNRKELLTRARKDEVVIIDVRPSGEYHSSHLPFAISIPLNELKKRLKQIPKDREVIAYCRGPYCLLAVEAVRLLRKNGYRARRLDDGIHEWKAQGLPLATG